MITELYRRFATGQYSIKDLATQTRKEGLLLAGKLIHASTLHLLLRRRLYCGSFDYDGITYQGTHEPLVTTQTWETVQRLLDQRKDGHTKAIRRDFPFTGLITCGHCGLAMVGEAKKQGRYVYWHCTGHRGKHPEEPYVRQETLTDQFAGIIGELVIPKDVLDWLAHEVTASDTTENAARQATIKRLEGDVHRSEQRLRTLYDDRLEGRITLALYDEKRELLQAQRTEAQQKLLLARDATRPPLTKAVDLLRLTSNAASAFRDQAEAEQRKLLTTTLKEATWKDATLSATLLEPFELLRRSNQHNNNGTNGLGGNGRDFENWLPVMDTFRTRSLQTQALTPMMPHSP